MHASPLLYSDPDEIKIKAGAEEACTVGLAWETKGSITVM
jgi:hypothetical protein